MEQIIEFITRLIIDFIGNTGYVGIFLLMAAESALIPIPSEVTMPFSGYLASVDKFNVYIVAVVGAVANLVGSLLAYWLGKWGQETVVVRLIERYGKFLLISVEEFHRSERWFRKYGEKIVFISRILPVIRTFISLPAGIAEMNIWRFSFLTIVGSLIWSAFLTYIGFVLGKNWNSLEVYYRKFEYLIIFFVIALGVYYLFHKLKRLRKKA